MLANILMIPATTTRAAWLRLVCTMRSSSTGRQSASTSALLHASLAIVIISSRKEGTYMYIITCTCIHVCNTKGCVSHVYYLLVYYMYIMYAVDLPSLWGTCNSWAVQGCWVVCSWYCGPSVQRHWPVSLSLWLSGLHHLSDCAPHGLSTQTRMRNNIHILIDAYTCTCSTWLLF